MASVRADRFAQDFQASAEQKKTQDEIRAHIESASLMQHVREISRYVRLSGSTDEALAFDYIEQKLKEWNVTCERSTHPAYISWPGRATLTIQSSEETREFPCITHAMSVSTTDSGVSGTVIEIGESEIRDPLRVRPNAIVLIDGLARPEATLQAVRAGAGGAIFISGDTLHEMIISPVWGSPSSENKSAMPNIPVVSILGKYGMELRQAMHQGEVTATLTTNVKTEWSSIPLLIAEVNGNVFPREVVLLAGHVDSWHYGAMDNASANAVQLEMLRIFKERQNQLQRTFRVAFWSGHSHGRYAGSTWYVDHHWAELNERLVAQLYVDSVGGKGATVLSQAWAMAETRHIAEEALRLETGDAFAGGRFGRAGDQSFYGIGVSGLFMCLSEQPPASSETGASNQLLGGDGKTGGLGWWWHTPEDTIDKIDPDFLQRDARIYALSLKRLLEEEKLPLDFRETVKELRGHLTSWETKARGRISLQEAVDACERLQAAVDDYYNQEGDCALFNRKMIALERCLVPLNYTSGDRFEHDLALDYPPIPALAPLLRLVELNPDDPDAQHTEVLLRRRLNYVCQTLREAMSVVAEK
ncbi:MAG: M28 family peptidase [Bacilli bacterium]